MQKTETADQFKPRLLIDFDNTITRDYGLDNPPCEGVKESILKLAEKYHIVIFTCRANLRVKEEANRIALIAYLDTHDIHYDEIYSDKPVFAAIIDDRTFNPNHLGWDKIVDELMK